MRSTAKIHTAATPRLAVLGRKAMPAVELPSKNSAMVSLVARPQRRWIAIDSTVPIGRAMNASEKIAKAQSVPSRRPMSGKNTAGKTSTEAMP